MKARNIKLQTIPAFFADARATREKSGLARQAIFSHRTFAFAPKNAKRKLI